MSTSYFKRLSSQIKSILKYHNNREVSHVYLWLIHADVWQKPIQHRKAITLQLKISKHLKTICSHDG